MAPFSCPAKYPMKITFTKPFGSHQPGDSLELPDQVANTFLSVGVATQTGAATADKPVSKTQPYKASKGPAKAVRKAF